MNAELRQYLFKVFEIENNILDIRVRETYYMCQHESIIRMLFKNKSSINISIDRQEIILHPLTDVGEYSLFAFCVPKDSIYKFEDNDAIAIEEKTV